MLPVIPDLKRDTDYFDLIQVKARASLAPGL